MPLTSTDIAQIKKQLFSALDKPKSAALRPLKKQLTTLTQRELDEFTPSSLSANPAKTHIQIMDFFSGAGGMTAGFASLNKAVPIFKILSGFDINPEAAKSFEKNFGAPGIVGDINDLREQSKRDEFLKKVPDYDKTKPLIVIGCAPCQGFTSHRKKSWGKKDSRNSLVETFAIVATKLNPLCIIIENVPEMFSKKYHAYFAKAENTLAQAGYTIHKNIYNTASFGVPQERFRMLVMAMKKDFLLPEPILKSKDYRSVRDAIGNLPKIGAGEICVKDAYHICAKHKPETIEVIKAVPKNGGNRPRGMGPKCLDRVKGFTDVYGRLFWDKPAITITQYARNPASGRYVHPEQDRGLTIREAALLQSFPMQYEFTGNFDTMFKQIGEAVPPRFSCAVAANALIELLSEEPTPAEKQAQTHYVTKPVNNSFSSVMVGLKRRND